LLAVYSLVVVYNVYEMFTKSSAATEIAGVGGRFAVEGYLSSLLLVSMESPYAY